MPAKRLPKEVFEVGAAAIARVHFATGKPVRDLAQSVWHEYERQCNDPAAVEDWVDAAGQAVSWVNEQGLSAPTQLMRHLQYFCQMYEDDGRPKKKRLLGGLWFAKDTYDPERVAKFLRKAQIYCATAQSGLAPLAPDSYQ